MSRRPLSCLFLLWACVMFLTGARPATAGDSAVPPVCHANVAANVTYAEIADRPERWACAAEDWSIRLPRNFLRFDLRGSGGDVPTGLTTRLTRFDTMRIIVIGADGASASRDVAGVEMTPAKLDWLMTTDLPRLAGRPETVILRIDGARHVGMLSDTRLIAGPDDGAGIRRQELLLAALCGMLCLPLLFNIAFFRVLRERFLLWHALATAFMLAHTLVTAGLINHFVTLDIGQLSIISAITVGGGIVSASLFSADLIEAGKLDPVHRKLLRAVALWLPPWTLFYLFAGGSLRPYSAPLYLASFLPLMALFIWVMIVAKRRGSRAVNFQIAAWLPVMLTALVRIVSALGATDAPLEMLLEQHYAMGLEVIITSLGMIDRLMMIRHQRDMVMDEIRIIEDRSERDPLTGLFNRRAVEPRFAELQAKGFRTMAIVDLDHFKRVNDSYGHTVGDEVLRAAAEALAPDENTLVVRMGGEEFLMLLRGGDAVERAERRRLAISGRVAADVPGLDRIVTASMGVVEHRGTGTHDNDFTRLYAHCDKVLYEAKSAGRNRTKRERIQAFAGNSRLRGKGDTKKAFFPPSG